MRVPAAKPLCCIVRVEILDRFHFARRDGRQRGRVSEARPVHINDDAWIAGFLAHPAVEYKEIRPKTLHSLQRRRRTARLDFSSGNEVGRTLSSLRDNVNDVVVALTLR